MYDIAIIGSGPAGYSAGIYASRALLSTVIFSGPQPGGQLTTTTVVENYAGFPEGIGGVELLEAMKKQAQRFGVSIQSSVVTSIVPKKTGGPFTIFTDAGQYEARTVLLATGAQAKKLGIETENRFAGKGVSYCATCDGFFFRGKDVAVLGGGDTAMEEATFLTTFASHVTVIHRRDEFRASAIMLEKAKKNPKISFLTNKAVESFYGDLVLKGITLVDTKTNKKENLPVGGAFVAIGHTPATAFLKDFIELDEKGYIVTFNRLAEGILRGTMMISEEKRKKINDTESLFSTHTSVRGVFAAGDCVDHVYRQGIVAAGSGAMAAIDAQRYLESAK